jgi:hypothetical protein
MPWIWQAYRDAALSRCKLDVFEVDNTNINLGVMRSHNLGIDEMHRVDADWLLILSAAVRFGPNGGLDFIKALETTHAEAHIVNCVGLFGWHLMAFRRDLIDTVGRWDENFYPYGFDDNDMAIRIRKGMPHANWWGVTGTEISDTTMGHSIKLAKVHSPANPLLEYFAAKWGQEPHGQEFETFNDHPFNDPVNPIGYWPPIHGAEWDKPAP